MYLLEYDFHNKENDIFNLLVLRRTVFYTQRMYILRTKLQVNICKAHPT